MLWFVEGTISRRFYMADKEDTFTHRTLVQAASESEARDKYEAYWNAKTDEYSVYYFVRGIEVNETIV